ncbi:MAG: M14 family zinc carboxypeptidase [Bacteroidota bacterium]|nr:M14 family zinc carboxypeptidase [Bacteroidota bacterium]
MKTFFFLLVLGMTTQLANSQFSKTLFNSYDSYKFNDISTRRFKHADLMNYLEILKKSLGDLIQVEQIGSSAENRSINLLMLGTGKMKIFMWSQMHGDEPTATMGLLDLLNYISKNKNSSEIKKILSETTLLIIPMLNPDGAERFQRRTSQGIDMNRDALRLQTPEARILKATRDRFNPEIGFNLHDQDPRYSVGDKGTVAVISLLAPAYNVEKSDNVVRTRAKKLASELTLVLQQFVDNHIGKYDDTFEPRAFGDNIQKWGTSVVLIESGGWKDDNEKMFIRKLNCVGLLSVFHSIATNAYEKTSVDVYENIPMNTKNLFDLIIEKATILFSDGRSSIIADIAVNVEEIHDPSGTVWKGRIVDVGDLSVFSANEKWNGTGRSIDASLVEMNDIVSIEELKNIFQK